MPDRVHLVTDRVHLVTDRVHPTPAAAPAPQRGSR